MRLTIVQYGGDYREAWRRFDQGGKANYQAQRYSVDFVGSLAARYEQVVVICAVTDEAYDELLPNKLRAIGLGLRDGFHPRAVISPVARTSPDRLVVVTPLLPLLKWANRNRVRTLATLADSFQKRGIRERFRHRRLAYQLNQSNVEWVGNHGIAACLSLLSIDVRSDKIIPWDWPPSHVPSSYARRVLDSSHPLSLVFVGSVTAEKGVGDLLHSLEFLKAQGLQVGLKVVGRDPDGSMNGLASRLGLNDQVQFCGLIANEDVPNMMRAADIVVIPSRHEYPEGLPLTIYEALAARTPIVASDHPMFRGTLIDQQTAVIFRAGDPSALAQSIRRLAADPVLYTALSENSEQAWAALQLPVTWGELIQRWLSDDKADREWLANYAVGSGRYNDQIMTRDLQNDSNLVRR